MFRQLQSTAKPVVLVTGATGKVGCAAIRTLLSVRPHHNTAQHSTHRSSRTTVCIHVQHFLTATVCLSHTAPFVLSTDRSAQDRFPSGSFTIRAAAKDTERLKSCKEKSPQLETAVFDLDDPTTYDAVLRGVTTALLVDFIIHTIIHPSAFD